ncbi:MAG: N-acetylmuramoyl-L-alanine amidase [Verrucomicrobiae bacterium]|nr:N-acetylmuramoyl-L-alanine amidase [Verrucomicrobiae bacterium]MDW7980133.1 N-acetylmuramoyl-L-alanine amidase [Verrucomicrobiales bacterium]
MVLALLTGCVAQSARKPAFKPIPARVAPAPESAQQPALPQPPQPTPAAPVLIEPGHDATWVSFDEWSQQNGFNRPRRISLHPLKCVIETPRGLLSVEAGRDMMQWNGTEVQLGFIPFARNGVLFVHALDVRKNMIPLLLEQAALPRPGRIIVLDPGHGGRNTGARSIHDGVFEKDLTLDIALRLKPLLEARGWKVYLTRTNDVDVPLTARVAFADEKRADLFLSLHLNSAHPSQRESGIETYCLTPAGMPSNLTRGFEDSPVNTYPNNNYDTQNLQYAVRIHRALVQLGVSRDRGVRRARFLGVLRGQNRPAVLVEAGYLSNPDEARRLADPAFRQTLAEAIASALE